MARDAGQAGPVGLGQLTQLQLATAGARCAGCGGWTTGLGGHRCGVGVAPELARVVAFMVGERQGEAGEPEAQAGVARLRRLALIKERVAALRARRGGGLQ